MSTILDRIIARSAIRKGSKHLTTAQLNALTLYARQTHDKELMGLCIEARHFNEEATTTLFAFVRENQAALSELYDVFEA